MFRASTEHTSLKMTVAQDLLAAIHLPITIALKSQSQQSVFGIVPLAAVGTLQIAPQRSSLLIIVFGNCEGCAAAARHEIQLQVGFFV
jgi:hypothetical protein